MNCHHCGHEIVDIGILVHVDPHDTNRPDVCCFGRHGCVPDYNYSACAGACEEWETCVPDDNYSACDGGILFGGFVL